MSQAEIEAAVLAESVVTRFWSKVRKGDSCWEWTGSVCGFGYGFLHHSSGGRRRPLRAHRTSWVIHNGPIPDGLCVLHHCDNPRCVRPDHLWLGTKADNMQDAARKGRVCTTGRAARTSCGNGHDYASVGFRVTTAGHRRCLACLARQIADATAARRARRQAATAACRAALGGGA